MNDVLVRGASVFDGREFIGRRDLLLSGGVITRISPEIKADDAELVDAAGLTVLPGMIDSHVHTWGESLVEALTFGVTTVIDMFMAVSAMQSAQSEQNRGPVSNRADLISAGNVATAAGGHGTQYGVPVDTISSPSEARAFVTSRIEEGSDFIKIIWEPGGGDWPTLNEETIAAVVDAAHENGKLAVIHVTQYKLTRRAIEMGVDGLAHIFGDEPPADDFGQLLAPRGTFAIPTLSVIASSYGLATGSTLIMEDGIGPFLMPHQISNLERTAGWSRSGAYENAKRAVGLIHAAGGRILAGTDAPNPGTTSGASMHKEIELLHDCGLNVSEALAAATSVPAQVFGLSDRGTIAEGKVADLVLVGGDPSKSLSDTRKIKTIIKRGVVFDRDAQAARAAVERQRIASLEVEPVDVGDGMISDFESGLSSRFGFGWSTSTDSIMGGQSVASIEITPGGAGETLHSLTVSGETKEGYLFPWAGAMFAPGSEPMTPANLSSKKGVAFWARGDGGNYVLSVMADSLGFIPSSKAFNAGKDWEAFEVTFEELGLKANDVTAIMFLCHEKRGFQVQIDEVRLI